MDDDVNFALMISKYSRYPVTNLLSESRAVPSNLKNIWWLDCKRVSNINLTPKFSGRNYFFNALGALREIKSSHKEVTILVDFKSADIEIRNFISLVFNKPLIDVPGGNILNKPFQDSCSISNSCSNESPFSYTESESIDENEKVKYFYELVFKDLGEALELIGDAEMNSLRTYTKKSMEHVFPHCLELDFSEINEYVNDLIISSITKRETIQELCIDEEDRFILVKAYEDELAKIYIDYLEDEDNLKNSVKEILEEETSTDGVNYENDEEPVTDSSFTYAESVLSIIKELKESKSKNSQIMVQDISNDLLENIENLMNFTIELSKDENDAYSEDISFILDRDCKNMLFNLRKSAVIFRDDDLVEKIDKILIKAPISI
jgi:hypothetical protein